MLKPYEMTSVIITGPDMLKEKVIKDTSFEFEGKKIQIKGFVASVEHAKQILLKGSKGDFKASVNLFTNGRLRQEDIFEEVTRQTVTEEYLYGEIHIDGFEDAQQPSDIGMHIGNDQCVGGTVCQNDTAF